MKALYLFWLVFGFTPLFSEQPTFDWDKTPIGKSPQNQNTIQNQNPAPNVMDPFSRFDAMRKKMEEIQKRFFSDPFVMQSPLDDLDLFRWRMPSPGAGLANLSQVQIREMQDFLLVEFPIPAGEDPKSYEFQVQGSFLSIAKKEEKNLEENSSGMQKKVMSFSQSSSAISLPVPVGSDFTRQDHKDKILITFKKL